jgi:hypothetical protein
MTVPLCTIDIIAYLARPDVAATKPPGGRGASYTQGFPAFLQLGAHVGQAKPSSTRRSGITPGLVASRSCRGWTLSPSSGIHPLKNPKACTCSFLAAAMDMTAPP